MWTMDPGVRPLYRSLYNAIRKALLEGQVMPGEKLPSKRDVAEALNLSVNTVEIAYEQLAAEGYIEAKQRRGYFAADVEGLIHFPDRIHAKPAERDMLPVWRYDLRPTGVDPDHLPTSAFSRHARAMASDPALFEDADPAGLFSLRQEIARYLSAARGFFPDPEQIVVASGSEELIERLLTALSNPSVAVEDPGFPKPGIVARRRGLPIHLVPVEKGGMSGFAHAPSNGLWFVSPTHQFPTGTLMNIPDRAALLQQASLRNSYLLEDDYDSEFRYSGRPIPALKSIDADERVIYMGSFAKSIAPQMRMSYLVLPMQLLPMWWKADAPEPKLGTPVMILVSRFLSSGDFERHLRRMRRVYRQKRARLAAAVTREGLGELEGEAAGGYAILSLPTCVSTHAICEEARSAGIAIEDLDRYRMKNDTKRAPKLILGFSALPEEKIDDAIGALAQIILRFTAL